jgi:methylenetetrahydrofolate dehydrogenase (NADP+)/methenyltetrahydrofolate cyclohydrolase/formyltetrahydrofolate synthetase
MMQNLELVRKGCVNLIRHIENANKFGVKVVVAINKFSKDTQAEIDIVLEAAKQSGAFDAVLGENWEKGGAGAKALGEAVIAACEAHRRESDGICRFLYDLDLPIDVKIREIAQKMYGARDIELSDLARSRIDMFTQQGFDKLPICMAKTQYSFTSSPDIKGAPSDFILPIKDIRASIGAGFIYPLVGDVI